MGLLNQPKEIVICKRNTKPNLCFGMEVFELSVPVYRHVFNVGKKSAAVVTRALVPKPAKNLHMTGIPMHTPAN